MNNLPRCVDAGFEHVRFSLFEYFYSVRCCEIYGDVYDNTCHCFLLSLVGTALTRDWLMSMYFLAVAWRLLPPHSIDWLGKYMVWLIVWLSSWCVLFRKCDCDSLWEREAFVNCWARSKAFSCFDEKCIWDLRNGIRIDTEKTCSHIYT